MNKKTVLNATKWSSITEILAKLISPITSMILARLLTPDAFGVIATITMITSFFDMITEAGFSKFIIYFDEEKAKLEGYLDTAFWSNFSLSSLFLLLIIIFSKQISCLLGNPGIDRVLIIASISLPITSFSSIQIALFKRNFQFKTLFKMRIIGVFIPFAVTIPLALLGFSYWSLVIGTITVNLFNAFFSTFISNWKPSFNFSFDLLKKMLSFSIWSLFETILTWSINNIGVIVLVGVLSSYYLGIYKTCMNLVSQILGLIYSMFIPVLYSVLSRLKDDKKEFSKMFLSFQQIIALIVLPLGTGIFIFNETVTQILLGEKWLEGAFYIGLLGIAFSWISCISNLKLEGLRAIGKPKYNLISQMIVLIVLLFLLFINKDKSFNYICIITASAYIIYPLIDLFFIKSILHISLLKLFKNVFPIVLCSCIMGAFGFLMIRFKSGFINNIIEIIICIIIYIVLILLNANMRNKVKILFNYIRKKYE